MWKAFLCPFWLGFAAPRHPAQDDSELFGERHRGFSDVPITLWTVPEMASVGASVMHSAAGGNGGSGFPRRVGIIEPW